MARRVLIHARVSEAALQWADKLTNPSGPTRADVIRAMLSVAASHPEEVAKKLATVTAVDRIDR